MGDPKEAVQDPAREVIEAYGEARAGDLREDAVQGAPASNIGALVRVHQRHRHQHTRPDAHIHSTLQNALTVTSSNYCIIIVW